MEYYLNLFRTNETTTAITANKTAPDKFPNPMTNNTKSEIKSMREPVLA